MKGRIIFHIIFLSLFVSLISQNQAFAEDDNEIGDLLRNDMARLRNSREGIEELMRVGKQMLDEDPDSYEYNWQYAAVIYFYGDFYETNTAMKKEYFTQCKDYAYIAVRLNPDGAAGHYWLAIGYAMWAEANGILLSLFYADDVAKEVTKTIEIDPAFFYGTPWIIRAKVRAFAPGWPISVGNKELALLDIEKALEYGPEYRVIYQQAAEIYIHLEKWENARKSLEDGLALPVDELRSFEEQLAIDAMIERLDFVYDKLES